MRHYFTVKYWFDVNPEPLSNFGFTVLIAFIVLLFILGLISLILKRRGGLFKKILNNLYSFSGTNLFIGLIFCGIVP